MTSIVLENLEDLISKSVDVSNKLLTDIIAHVRNKVVVSERVSSELLDNYQFEAHGVALSLIHISEPTRRRGISDCGGGV